MIRINNQASVAAAPNCVIFDLDDTLYPYAPSHAKAMETVREKAIQSIGLTAQQFDDAFTEARKQVKETLKGTASSHSRLLYFQRLLELVGLRSQALLALDLEQAYWRRFLDEAHLFHGVMEFLDDLRLNGTPIALVSDLTTQIQLRKLVYLGLDSHFEHIVTSEEAGKEKPDPSPFRLAMNKLGDVGSNIWMIGDNPVADIRGARACLNAVTFQKVHDGVRVGEAGDAPDVVFHEFSELRALFSRLVR
ncbi:HAD family hydrolase [Aquabacter sp. P-9]|uniref:HAD family hydrolase n=1 Tax=Aquabacter sediminis TaxID=3029197 RepID=UPI00237EB4BC|nr:HAD family hydrolase [Aquabacter sp. P-9]MDE1567249.1 HAD family hydrolase [Aquabacter sp. P-9]